MLRRPNDVRVFNKMLVSFRIENISADATLDLRQKVLKPFLSRKECINSEDNLPTTKHFGLFYNDRLAAIATIFPESNVSLDCGYPFRLRGMASDPNFQGQGFGSALLMHIIEYLKEKKCDLLWCNARIRAFTFYQSNGFQFCGDLFELKDIGPHKIMYRRIIAK